MDAGAGDARAARLLPNREHTPAGERAAWLRLSAATGLNPAAMKFPARAIDR